MHRPGPPSAGPGPLAAGAPAAPFPRPVRHERDGPTVLVLNILLYVVCALTAALAIYYTVRDLSADLVLLGACVLVLGVWALQFAALGLRDLTGGTVPDPITLYGYLLTGLALPLGGVWLGVWERTRWGSLAIMVAALTLMVLQLRLHQLWPGGFA